MITLYDYFRSSTCYRVRIALHLKGLAFETSPVNLLEGAHTSDAYRDVNAMASVPTIEIDGMRLTQSLAILEYLEARYPTPPLLPGDAKAQAQIRAMAQLIATDIYPLNNLRVLKYLTGTLKVSEADKTTWYHHWIRNGFVALERMIQSGTQAGGFCFGNSPTIADICLIPQIYNAKRFDTKLDDFPSLLAIYEHCMGLEAFRKAAPEVS